jgi:flagellar hook protein FlgE
VATVDTLHTQGALQSTGKVDDVAIQGNGFFILKNGERTFYTRAGAFGVDMDGRLVNPANGLRVQGWMTQRVGTEDILNVSNNPEDLIIPIGTKEAARATTEVNYACNLDKRTEEIPDGANEATIRRNTVRTDFDVYDAFGTKHVLRIDLAKVTGTPNQWNATATVDPEAAAPTNARVFLPGQEGTGNAFVVEFDNNGMLLGARVGDARTPVQGLANIQLAFDVPQTNPDATGAQLRQELTVNLGTIASTTNSITQFSSSTTTKGIMQDGYTMGYLDTFKIDQNGMITGVFSNGVDRAIGQMALASFKNPGGLEKAGENTYMVSNNSGLANVGTTQTGGRGKVIAGTLEMSNVDLAEQMTDMIVTQRGFQANSKTIQTSDQMLQELLTLKR